jgi:hypothetical protein
MKIYQENVDRENGARRVLALARVLPLAGVLEDWEGSCAD